MSDLWRALLQGVGWRLGKEAAEDAIRSLKGEGEPEVPVESPADAQKRLERERREAEKARVTARKAAEKRAKEVEREVDSELAALKKKVAKDAKR